MKKVPARIIFHFGPGILFFVFLFENVFLWQGQKNIFAFLKTCKKQKWQFKQKRNDLRFESHLAEIIIGSFCPEVVKAVIMSGYSHGILTHYREESTWKPQGLANALYLAGKNI